MGEKHGNTEPLTIEQLRGKVGQQVYFKALREDDDMGERWTVLDMFRDKLDFHYGRSRLPSYTFLKEKDDQNNVSVYYTYQESTYGKNWLVYEQPTE